MTTKGEHELSAEEQTDLQTLLCALGLTEKADDMPAGKKENGVWARACAILTVYQKGRGWWG